MSTANSSDSASPAGGHTPGNNTIKFESRRVSGNNGGGKILYLFQVKGIECAAEMVGACHAAAWVVDDPRRKTMVINGTVADAAYRLQAMLTSLDQPTQLTVVRQQPKALVIWQPVKEWRISQKQIDWLWKQSVVNEVTMKVHLGTATQKDFDALSRLRGKIPPPAPISIETETRRLVDFVLSVTHDRRGAYLRSFSNAAGHMRDCSRGAYGLKELSDGRIAAVNGKDDPNAVVFRKKADGSLMLCDAGLTKTLQKFVRELYPELPERVEPVVEDEVPY